MGESFRVPEQDKATTRVTENRSPGQSVQETESERPPGRLLSDRSI